DGFRRCGGCAYGLDCRIPEWTAGAVRIRAGGVDAARWRFGEKCRRSCATTRTERRLDRSAADASGAGAFAGVGGRLPRTRLTPCGASLMREGDGVGEGWIGGAGGDGGAYVN